MKPTYASQRVMRMRREAKRAAHASFVPESGWLLPLGTVRRKTIKAMWVGYSYAFSSQAWSFRSAQVLAHEARPRIGRPRQQGQAGSIGYMAYETVARNWSEINLNSGRSLQL